MTADTQDQAGTVPGTVFTPRQVRLLKIAVIVMGIMLVGGFALVLGTIVYQASSLGKSDVAATGPTPAVTQSGQAGLSEGIVLKPGQSVSQIALDGDRVAVYVTGPAGAEIRVVDLSTGSVVARVPVKPE